MKSIKIYLLLLFLASSFIVSTITASSEQNTAKSELFMNVITPELDINNDKIKTALAELRKMGGDKNAQELLTTGLPTTLKIVKSQLNIHDDAVAQKLGSYYEEFVSLGHEHRSFQKSEFVREGRILIDELRKHPRIIAILEETQK